MDRRNFIKNTLTGVSTLIVQPDFMSQLNSNFELVVLATNWGFDGTLEDFIIKSKTDNYNGVELWWPIDIKEQKELFNLINKHQLKIGFLCGSSSAHFEEHFKIFSSNLMAILNSDFKPLYINCHAGKDFFTEEQNSQIIDFCTEMSLKHKVKILQETHRSRMCFSTLSTINLLKKHPNLNLTLDISHWCNVHESMLDDQKETINFALTRTQHIHARIGHEEGPQVSDPRAPEWQNHLEKHLKWWDQAVKNQIEAGEKQITFLTEFGPPNYLPALPYTRQPVAKQWEINVFMKNLLTKRYSK